MSSGFSQLWLFVTSQTKLLQSYRQHYTTLFTGWTEQRMMHKLNFMCKIGGIPLENTSFCVNRNYKINLIAVQFFFLFQTGQHWKQPLLYLSPQHLLLLLKAHSQHRSNSPQQYQTTAATRTSPLCILSAASAHTELTDCI